MSRDKVGPVVTILIVAGVAAILVLNREPSRPSTAREAATPPAPAEPKAEAGPREYPIGDPAVKNHLDIAAVWLPSVAMAGMPDPSDDVIHLEADIRSTADNPNGFAKDEFVPYLTVHYEIRPAAGGKVLQEGAFLPMVAADGLHYGANVLKPPPGEYTLVYKIDPPTALGRHVGAGGVAPWWGPFEATFEWTVEAGK